MSRVSSRATADFGLSDKNTKIFIIFANRTKILDFFLFYFQDSVLNDNGADTYRR